ncbi:MAG: M24 family metallopeptidase [bacterium]
MLNQQEYIKKFSNIQEIIVAVTSELIAWIEPGMNEKYIAERYGMILASNGLSKHWYPILVYAGKNTGKPISRRFHLPTSEDIIKKTDIVFVDCTPIDGTVWGNWSDTIIIGSNKFYESLVADTKEIVKDTMIYAKTKAKTVGDVYDYCINLVNIKGMTSLDLRNDIGHSIFQVPIDSTVEDTPMGDRIFISKEYQNKELSGILSIEPQLGRINPEDGLMYGAKTQEVIVYS